MSPERQRELYLEGIGLFNAGEFFAAHERWEDVWREAAGREKLFFQGLIQCAVALEHARRSNPRGAARLHGRYPGKFKDLPADFMGLNIAGFLEEMERALGPIVRQDPIPERGQVSLSEAALPKIGLRSQFPQGSGQG